MSDNLQKYDDAFDRVSGQYETINDGSFSGFPDLAKFLKKSAKEDAAKGLSEETKKAVRDSIRD
ncbi:MAG TPA: hypothetical protein DD827_04465 [Gammaproteobacteria bacterium]|nr:hypothetical protein [Gammaproteobacteria bacterium]